MNIPTPKSLDPNEIVRYETCQQCAAEIPLYRGYALWCDQCNWNLLATQIETKPTRLSAFYERLGKGTSQRLYEQVLALPKVERQTSALVILAAVLATLVHAVTFVLAVGGISLLIIGWPNPFAIVFSIAMLATAAYLRPHIAPMPKVTIERSHCPALYSLLDRIASQFSAQPVHAIVITPDYNASYHLAGWRQKPIVSLGLPLMTVLNQQERVALLSHELAHGVNGDPMRGFWIGSAVNSLISWSFLIRPSRIFEVSMGGAMGAVLALLMVPINLLLLGLSYGLWYCALGLNGLVFYDSQRAEYLADYLASTISGTPAMLTTLEKLYLGDSFPTVVQRVFLNRNNTSVLSAFHAYVAALPARELERRRRLSTLQGAKLDSTHPPTANRINFLSSHPVDGQIQLLNDEEWQAIDTELATFEAPIQRILKERFESGLNG